jgi:hypothetical protein
MEPKRKIAPYVWQRFKSRLKTRLLIFAAILVVFVLLKFATGGL